MCEVEPPRDEPRDRGLCRRRRLGVAVCPEERDSNGARVEPQCVRAHDVSIDSAEAALVDRPEAVDEKVVADVVPAVSLHVEELNPLDDRGGLGAGVVVATGRVVDDRESHSRRVGRRAASNRLIGPPREPRHDRRRSGRGRNAERDANRGAPHELRSDSCHVPDHACLETIRRPNPERIPEAPTGTSPLERSSVGAVFGFGRRTSPGAPAAAGRACPQNHSPAATPRYPCKREPRKSTRLRHTLGANPQVDGCRMRRTRAERTRSDQQACKQGEEDGEKRLSHGSPGWLLNRSRARAANLR